MDSQQKPNRHRQRDNRKKQILNPNLTTDHRRSMTNQNPKQDWHIFGLGVSAHQPRCFRFPKRQFGKSKLVFRSFHVTWFDSCLWLHCVEDDDNVICHACTLAHITNQLATLTLDAVFITEGYTNGKDATRKKAGFSQREIYQCHWEAVERSITLHATTKDAGEHISSTREGDNANNRKATDCRSRQNRCCDNHLSQLKTSFSEGKEQGQWDSVMVAAAQCLVPNKCFDQH